MNLTSFYVWICRGSRHVTPLFQLFKMESTSDSCYKHRAVIEFLVAVKERVQNIHKWLGNAYGNAAVDRSAIGCRAKRVWGQRSMKGAAPWCSPWARNMTVTVFLDCEGVILIDVIQTGKTTQMCISAYRKKWGSISNKFGLTRSCVKCYFSAKTQGLTCVRILEAITQMYGQCYHIHPAAPA
jgi:hypothetical protein